MSNELLDLTPAPLIGFLLARIHEFESAAGAVHTATCTHDTVLHGTPCLASCQIPARIRAECEAKRRIVDLESLPGSGMAGLVYAGALRALALPFADHPDYDPAWAPAEEGA